MTKKPELKKVMYPVELIKYLKSKGFVELEGGDGSHCKLKNFATGDTTTVPIHNKPLKRGTLNAILRQTGLK